MMENAYKTMRKTGAASITLGIIALVVGIATGVLLIVSGGNLLVDSKKLTF